MKSLQGWHWRRHRLNEGASSHDIFTLRIGPLPAALRPLHLKPVALALGVLVCGAAPGHAQAIDNLLAPAPASPGSATPGSASSLPERAQPQPRSANPPPRQPNAASRAPAVTPGAGQPAVAEPETYWSISVGPKTITLGYGVEPGSEQAAIRLVCSPRDSFIALNMSRGANPQMLERIKRIAGSEIPVTLQIERARFTARGPVVEADDPALPITVVLRSSLDDPAIAAIRQGRRLRVSWQLGGQPGGQQGGFETSLENFAELEEEWQSRCARLAATEAPIGSEAAPPPVRRAPAPGPASAPADAAPAPAAPSFPTPAPSFSAPVISAPAQPEVFRPGDSEIPRPPANVPSRLPPQEPPTVIDR
jgi:hypothetical protein